MTNSDGGWHAAVHLLAHFSRQEHLETLPRIGHDRFLVNSFSRSIIRRYVA
jgi:hypothetical protein